MMRGEGEAGGATARPEPDTQAGLPALSGLPPSAPGPSALPGLPPSAPGLPALSGLPPSAPGPPAPSRLPPGVTRIRVTRDDNDGLRTTSDFTDVPAALAEVERHMRRPGVYSIMIVFDA
jgi:hypothetical protein